MKKKYFIPFLIIGSLLLFSILPIINYKTDIWRVLHHDYKHHYSGRTPNSSFLKVSYLLDNKEKYDTLIMGSSRGGYMDMSLIPGSVYNMKFIFGTTGVHLHNLKILLENDLQIKNLWIGMNEYVIWKNPKDHDNSFKRRTYPDTFFASLSTYSFYLFENITAKHIQVLKGESRLIKSSINTNPNKNNMPFAYRREKKILKNPDLRIKKMKESKPTLLGYNDDEYRIDEAIEEIKEIKKLCTDNNITLTLFMYPSFYRTYLKYNQYKIEEFKRKLSLVSHFHDFYYLRDWSLNELLWHDSSHFTVSIGNQIIRDIQKNKFLVTKDTINNQIVKTREAITNILKKPLNYIYEFNVNIDLKALKNIFNLTNNKNDFFFNDHMTLKKEKSFVAMHVKGNDPVLILNKVKATSKNVILTLKMESKKKTVMTLFYKKRATSNYNESDAYRIHIHEGMNEFNILIPKQYINNQLRIDPVDKDGNYKLKALSIYELDEDNE
ncbi:MAG: hypothetical protein DRQ78_07985 [Epsilonproteobacteria bacterium]|nr:MAG: hypothetical protein DRQ78_07985 [Campylobacterota bacterium]